MAGSAGGVNAGLYLLGLSPGGDLKIRESQLFSLAGQRRRGGHLLSQYVNPYIRCQMSSYSPIEPDFRHLHAKGVADVWWTVTILVGGISAALPAIGAHLSIGYLWLTGLTGFVSTYWFFSHLCRLGRKERTTLALDDQGLNLRIWAANKGQQIALGFEDVGVYFGYQLLARPIGQDTDNFDGHEFIIRNAKDTVALANVIRIHDEAYWPLAIYEFLELDGEQISLSSIFEQPDVRSRMNLAQSARSDFICIGLTTNGIETVGRGGTKMLSEDRAKSLGVALISYAGLDQRRSQFYAVGLGQALTHIADPESQSARDQRSAVILAITRRQDISEILDLEHITEALIQNYRTERIDLSNYEFSNNIARQLFDSQIDFAGYV